MRYAKLITALLGAGAIGLNESGLMSPDDSALVANSVLGLLSAFGVWAVPNRTN